MPNYLESISKTIQRFLEREEMFQDKLAEKIGVSSSTITRYIKNQRKPNIIDLIRMADFFEISLDEFVGRDHKEKRALRWLHSSNFKTEETDKSINLPDGTKIEERRKSIKIPTLRQCVMASKTFTDEEKTKLFEIVKLIFDLRDNVSIPSQKKR